MRIVNDGKNDAKSIRIRPLQGGTIRKGGKNPPPERKRPPPPKKR